MGNRVLVVAPHMDDEILGAGGTMLRHVCAGDEVRVVTLCERHREKGSLEKTKASRAACAAISSKYGIQYSHYSFENRELSESQARQVLIDEIDHWEGAPMIVYGPWVGDVHQDHRAAGRAVGIATRMVRDHDVISVRCYEVLTSTDQTGPGDDPFLPNLFFDITRFLEAKIEMMSLFESEISQYPFSRSPEGIRALAMTRGMAVHLPYAEAFMIRRQVERDTVTEVV